MQNIFLNKKFSIYFEIFYSTFTAEIFYSMENSSLNILTFIQEKKEKNIIHVGLKFLITYTKKIPIESSRLRKTNASVNLISFQPDFSKTCLKVKSKNCYDAKAFNEY